MIAYITVGTTGKDNEFSWVSNVFLDKKIAKDFVNALNEIVSTQQEWDSHNPIDSFDEFLRRCLRSKDSKAQVKDGTAFYKIVESSLSLEISQNLTQLQPLQIGDKK